MNQNQDYTSSDADLLQARNFSTRRDVAAWICQKMQFHYFLLSWPYFPCLGLAHIRFCGELIQALKLAENDTFVSDGFIL